MLAHLSQGFPQDWISADNITKLKISKGPVKIDMINSGESLIWFIMIHSIAINTQIV